MKKVTLLSFALLLAMISLLTYGCGNTSAQTPAPATSTSTSKLPEIAVESKWLSETSEAYLSARNNQYYSIDRVEITVEFKDAVGNVIKTNPPRVYWLLKDLPPLAEVDKKFSVILSNPFYSYSLEIKSQRVETMR